jgi:hypothetical protein
VREQDLPRDAEAASRSSQLLDRLWHALGAQLRHPSGPVGFLVGWFMAIANDEPNRLAIDALELQPTDRVLGASSRNKRSFGDSVKVTLIFFALRSGCRC